MKTKQRDPVGGKGGVWKRKRLRYFSAPVPEAREENQTILLSDTEADENQNTSRPPDDDIQVIDIADVSDVLEEGEIRGSPMVRKEILPGNVKKEDSPGTVRNTRESSSASPLVINICDEADGEGEEDNDDIEVVAVVVSSNPRSSLTKRKRKSLSERKSNNGNFNSMQGSIRKAKNTVRRSNSINSLNMTPVGKTGVGYTLNGVSQFSKQIKRKNKKERKRFQTQQQAANRRFQGRGRFNFNRSKEDRRKVIYRTTEGLVEGRGGVHPWQRLAIPTVSNPFDPENFSYDHNPFKPSATSTPAQGSSQSGEITARVNLRESDASNVVPGSNIMNVGTTAPRVPGALRPIVIDGSNVAVGHGKMIQQGGNRFSARGIKICVDYFLRRGHKEIVVFVPRFRLKKSESIDPELLEEMERDGYVRCTPSREAGQHRISSYDDLYVVQYAHETKGIIVSNDNFRDLYETKEEWRDTIEYGILQYTWITQDCIMFPQDPLGRRGPTLDEFLRF